MNTQAHHLTGDRDFWLGLARAFGGATLFALPMLMTMEMWWLGFSMDPFRLALFIMINVFLLIGLERYRGFKQNVGWTDTIIDAFVGYTVGFIAAAAFLPLLGVIRPDMSMDEMLGKITLQAVPASIGALLARSQFGGSDQNDSDEQEMSPTRHYIHEMFLMVTGALFVSLNVAPTEEIMLIAYRVTPWIALMLMAISIVLIHTFVYVVDFRGQEDRPDNATFLRVFTHFSIAGYAMVLLVSFYILWTFGRIDGQSLSTALHAAIVLATPGAVGAAAARLII